jgi:leucyl aminopeptidase
MIGADAIRPSDVITTAAGLTVEVKNPDAEGRLILADALWYARVEGATHLVDLATLTGAMRARWAMSTAALRQRRRLARCRRRRGQRRRRRCVAWPLHRRYRRLLDSTLADLRNTSGKPFGYPITAATFLERFAGDGPWAHVDMIGPALLDDDRGDAIGRVASGYGVRMLVELARRLADTPGDPRARVDASGARG